MKNRRYFLVQSTLATTAMIALKPLTSIGNTLSQFSASRSGYRKLAFLHTANLGGNDNNVIKYIQDIRNRRGEAILLNAGEGMQDRMPSLVFDASIKGSNDLSAIDGEYKIVTKGNTRTGVISARPGDRNVIQKIKILSTWLKKEKECTIVVCLSQLGYKNSSTPDDITLAKESTDLDIIVGGHAQNFHTYPVVVLNSNQSEVVIHSASGNSFDYGKIEIDFDRKGKKYNIGFADHPSKNITPNRARANA